MEEEFKIIEQPLEIKSGIEILNRENLITDIFNRFQKVEADLIAEKKEKKEFLKKVILEISNIAESVFRILKFLEEKENKNETEISYISQMKLLLEKLDDFIKNLGGEIICPHVGQKFDQKLKEICMVEEYRKNTGKFNGIVLEVSKRGLILDGEVVKTAKIVVSK